MVFLNIAKLLTMIGTDMNQQMLWIVIKEDSDYQRKPYPKSSNDTSVARAAFTALFTHRLCHLGPGLLDARFSMKHGTARTYSVDISTLGIAS